ncbi:MAG TPA: hypothetical protein VFM39_00920 [bacterium]|nr:hypothetical protein [bacterium]
MRRLRRPLVVVALAVAASVYAYGFEGGGHQVRLLRHLVGTGVQIFAPLVATLGCLVAARAYASGDRERLVWSTGALAALSWAVGRMVFAANQWWGGIISQSPSVADGFSVLFYVLLGVALLMEVRLVGPMIDRPFRLALLALGVAGLAAGFVFVVEPIVQSSTSSVEKALAAFYPSAAVFFIPAGLAPAVGFRGGTSAYVWLAVALGALCLALASLGHAMLSSYGLYSEVHSINALWVAGFMLLALGGFWQRMVQEEV